MSEETESRYLDYLPGIYHEHPFLGQFLQPFEEVFDGFEDQLSDINRYFAPYATDAAILPWLSTWLALSLDETWDDLQRRRIIAEAIKLYRWRGTVWGLKRYLEIYTGVVPAIHESAWPGGMQIGVASRIGGPGISTSVHASDDVLRIVRAVRRRPTFYDYYVVDSVAPEGHDRLSEGDPIRYYYRSDRVRRVDVDLEVEEPGVEIELFSGEIAIHRPATIVRRDGLIEDRYIVTVEAEEGTDALMDATTTTVNYLGDTLLIDTFERPYHFVVDVRTSPRAWEQLRDPSRIQSIRTILDLEKPAHTEYYLKLSQVSDEQTLRRTPIGKNAGIGLDSIIG